MDPRAEIVYTGYYIICIMVHKFTSPKKTAGTFKRFVIKVKNSESGEYVVAYLLNNKKQKFSIGSDNKDKENVTEIENPSLKSGTEYSILVGAETSKFTTFTTLHGKTLSNTNVIITAVVLTLLALLLLCFIFMLVIRTRRTIVTRIIEEPVPKPKPHEEAHIHFPHDPILDCEHCRRKKFKRRDSKEQEDELHQDRKKKKLEAKLKNQLFYTSNMGLTGPGSYTDRHYRKFYVGDRYNRGNIDETGQRLQYKPNELIKQYTKKWKGGDESDNSYDSSKKSNSKPRYNKRRKDDYDSDFSYDSSKKSNSKPRYSKRRKDDYDSDISYDSRSSKRSNYKNMPYDDYESEYSYDKSRRYDKHYDRLYNDRYRDTRDFRRGKYDDDSYRSRSSANFDSYEQYKKHKQNRIQKPGFVIQM